MLGKVSVVSVCIAFSDGPCDVMCVRVTPNSRLIAAGFANGEIKVTTTLLNFSSFGVDCVDSFCFCRPLVFGDQDNAVVLVCTCVCVWCVSVCMIV